MSSATAKTLPSPSVFRSAGKICRQRWPRRGIAGVIEGIDYRGVPVLATLRKIPDSPWFLVAKIDQQEVYGLIKKQTQFVAIIVALLILFSGAGLGLLWRQQSAKFYKKQLEADRKSIESQEDLDRAQAVGNIGSWRLDIQRNNLTWSDENHRIFGIPKETPMTYETFFSTVHPDDRDYVDTKWKECLADKPYDIEHRIIVDGHVKWVREKAYLEFDSKGALIGGFGITQDITDARKWKMQFVRHGMNWKVESRNEPRNSRELLRHCRMKWLNASRWRNRWEPNGSGSMMFWKYYRFTWCC